jgi:dynein heavy chain 1
LFWLLLRFYFVGDEDLLEIIGNSKSIPKLQKHFKKMFAGVASIILNEDETLVTGLSSKEGEEVIFRKPVNLKQNPKVNEWLTCVENEMRTSLATLLALSVKEIQQFNTDKIDNEYMGWVDKYQVCTLLNKIHYDGDDD